ncbi:Gar1/Naf1 RNA binding region-domain-containing protein [Pisolithus marmoratus]|nr:Gar1/Naf1 RNA binding region-domain-containing protein [Pisolithus marmoratus]
MIMPLMSNAKMQGRLGISVSEVSPEDSLEKVGEVMSIVGNVVIVKGLPADNLKTLSERALDAETLLVFDDRKVLGYVYETFGPTSQPLYQIKFNQEFPMDTEKIRISREVFHVPRQSKYVFVEQLQKVALEAMPAIYMTKSLQRTSWSSLTTEQESRIQATTQKKAPGVRCIVQADHPYAPASVSRHDVRWTFH